MANQYVNKVIVNNEIKMDLTEDTITPNTLRKGFTAHDASGAPIVGNESLTDISEDGTNAGPILELNAEGWAEQKTISGKNLLPNTVSGTQTINGITFTVNSDKSITCTGTATADTTFDLATPNTILGEIPANVSYCCYGVPKGYDANCRLYIRTTTNINNLTGGSSSILQNGLANVIMTNAIEYINRVYIKITNGTTIDITIHPQLELGTMPTEYEPYCGGIPSPNPSYPQEIKVARGRNLLNPHGQSPEWLTVESDGKISCPYGQSLPLSYENCPYHIHLSAGTYSLSFVIAKPITNGTIYGGWCLYHSDGTVIESQTRTANSKFDTYSPYQPQPFTLTSDETIGIYIRPNGAELYAQLEEGSVATHYVPYGHVGMEVQGRNLWRQTSVADGVNVDSSGITMTVCDNGSGFVASGTATAQVAYPSALSSTDARLYSLLPAGTYTASSNTTYRVRKLVDGAVTEIKASTTGDWSFTLAEDTLIRIIPIIASGTVLSTPTHIWAQIELGSTAHTYEPYYHSTIPIPLPSKGFAAALPDGTSDILTLDGAGGYEWEMACEEVVYSGNENWSITNAGTSSWQLTHTEYTHKWPQTTNFYASHYKAEQITLSNTLEGMWLVFNGSERWVRIRYGSEVTAENFKSWLSSNPVTVLYPLATLVTEQGYVDNWNNDFPLGCTIDIPELRNTNVEYFLYDSITQLADDYYDRTTNDISEAMSQTSDSATLEALAAIAPIENDISSTNYAVGSYLIHDDKLCQVTQAIAANETITVGTNVVVTDVGSELDELNDAVDEINANPYILPTMSESTKGGAKVGYGLNVENDILSVGGVDDPNDAGPIVELSAKGWAEQFSTTGRNLAEPNSSIVDGTEGGLTFTKISEGVWKVSGTSMSTSAVSHGMKMYRLGTLAAGTYTIFMECISGTCDKSLIPRLGSTSSATYFSNFTNAISSPTKTVRTFQADGSTEFWACIQFQASSTVDGIFRLQVTSGSTELPYEPYTGGAPSPSPSYPQEIRRCVGRNLLRISPDLPQTINGITISNAGNGHVRVNGTATANTSRAFAMFDAKAGETYYVTVPTITGNHTFFLWDDVGSKMVASSKKVPFMFTAPATQEYMLAISIPSGTALNNFDIAAQVEEGATGHPYVPYGCVGVDVQGRNLLDPTKVSQTRTHNDIAYTVQADGGIKVTGTATANSYMVLAGTNNNLHDLTLGKTYTLSGTHDGVVCNASDNVTSPANRFGDTSLTTIIPATATTWAFALYVYSGTTVNTTIYPQLELGSVAHAYEPYYHTTIPIPLPSRGWVAALPDGTADTLTLDGAGGYVWTLNTAEKVLGDLTWTAKTDSTGQYFQADVTGRTHGAREVMQRKALCECFAISTSDNVYDGSLAFSGSTTADATYARDLSSADVATFLTRVGSAKLLYQLATPTRESGYVDSMPVVPAHSTLTCPDLTDLAVRCCADEGAAEISSAWGKRFEEELSELREIVNGLVDNS